MKIHHQSTRRRCLRFTPTAWAKLLFWRDRGDTEIGGFGLSAPFDLLGVTDVVLVPQAATPTFVRFDDAGVADHFDRQIDAGLTPEQCGRIWLHTHPGSDPTPSRTDEETFARVFGRCDWAVMAIVARHGATYARLQWHVGPGGWQRLGVELDWTGEFDGTDQSLWAQEYDRCVRPLEMELPRRSGRRGPLADLAAAELAFDDEELLTTSMFRKGEVFPV